MTTEPTAKVERDVIAGLGVAESFQLISMESFMDYKSGMTEVGKHYAHLLFEASVQAKLTLHQVKVIH